jgi:hypothetical protein
VTGVAALASAILIAGCGSGGSSARGPQVTTIPAAQRQVERAGVITVRGDVAPDEHGPFALHGRYRVTFTQTGAGVDFSQEVPFTAHLEDTAADGPGRSIKLFERAAAKGTTAVTADGEFSVVVDFGDSPYEIVLRPAPSAAPRPAG